MYVYVSIHIYAHARTHILYIVYRVLTGRVSNATNQWCLKFNVARGTLHAVVCN